MTSTEKNELQGQKELVGNGEVRDLRGRFLPGHVGTGGLPAGRPPGALDFVAICRQRSRDQGIDLADLLWAVARRLFVRATQGDGDVQAARLIVERLCGAVEKGSGVEVLVDNRQVNVKPGPPIPPTRELGRYLAELADVSKDLAQVPLDEDIQRAVDEILE